MLLLSITGLIKTVLLIIGVMVVLRFIGQLMIARRNLAEQQALKLQKEKERKLKKAVEKNYGKTNVISGGSKSKAEDVDYEEI